MQKATFETVVTMATLLIASPRDISRKISNKIVGKVIKFQLLATMHSKVIHKNIPWGGGGGGEDPPSWIGFVDQVQSAHMSTEGAS